MRKPTEDEMLFIERLLRASRGNGPQQVSNEHPDVNLRKLADDARWMATDVTQTITRRKKYLALARMLDLLVDGKTTQAAILPKFRTAEVKR